MESRHLLIVFLAVGSVAAWWMSRIHPGDGKTVAFELATDANAARAVLGPFDGETWRRMRACFHRDALLILGYTGFFVVAGLNLAPRSGTLAWAVALLGLAVGVLDVMENTHALAVLAADLTPASDALLSRMSWWSRLKWWSIGPLSLVLAAAEYAYLGVAGKVAAAAFAAAGLAFTASALVPSILLWAWPMLVFMAGMAAHAIAVFYRSIPNT